MTRRKSHAISRASTVRKKPDKPQRAYYTKTSSLQHAVIIDPVEEYRLSIQHLNKGSTNWCGLSKGDQSLQKEIQGLNPEQSEIYHRLIELLRLYVDRTCGVMGFNDTSTLYIWNWPTWHKAIIQVARGFVGPSCGENDCWFVKMGTDKSGRPSVTVRPSRTEVRWDVAFHRGLHHRYTVEGGARITTSTARLVGVLLHEAPPSDKYQASHLCHNSPQICINPRHLRWEVDKVNKGRNSCTYGAVMYCPHEVKCVYTNLAGRFLPHRNLIDHAECDCEGVACHKELCFLSLDVPLGDEMVVTSLMNDDGALSNPEDESLTSPLDERALVKKRARRGLKTYISDPEDDS
jgi:Zinc-binding loop region of homing endonuclease